ncbi:MAG TPA: UbiA family prenyltransferase, partial [Candidatus Limnocylindrales bacterium]|nr:UbiA family prenyltransferase [Candidatus Limnocylindrales bacterium]
MDGAATGAIALIAGAALPRTVALALAMTALQVSIGALNDLVDAPRDAVGQPWKPIPAGRVPRVAAAALAGVAAFLGLGLAVAIGPLVGALGVAI